MQPFLRSIGTDAANADLSVLKINRQFPERLLLMGLPLTILLGFGVLVFPGMTLFELAVLATMSWHNDV
ncbi:MAG: hypothetical protein WBR24_00840 [Desulfobacterales bacterium]|jgi:hypothetical protein